MVTGGSVVTPVGTLPADVVVEDGKIAALAEPGSGPARGERLDATGCFVLPGGVDPHCHVMADVAAALTHMDLVDSAADLRRHRRLVAFNPPAERQNVVRSARPPKI